MAIRKPLLEWDEGLVYGILATAIITGAILFPPAALLACAITGLIVSVKGSSRSFGLFLLAASLICLASAIAFALIPTTLPGLITLSALVAITTYLPSLGGLLSAAFRYIGPYFSKGASNLVEQQAELGIKSALRFVVLTVAWAFDIILFFYSIPLSALLTLYLLGVVVPNKDGKFNVPVANFIVGSWVAFIASGIALAITLSATTPTFIPLAAIGAFGGIMLFSLVWFLGGLHAASHLMYKNTYLQPTEAAAGKQSGIVDRTSYQKIAESDSELELKPELGKVEGGGTQSADKSEDKGPLSLPRTPSQNEQGVAPSGIIP